MAGRFPAYIRRNMKQERPPLRGWTSGTCATAAAAVFLGSIFPDPVEVTLPRGVSTALGLAESTRGDIDLGDFVGGMLKFLRAHPLPRVSLAGGVSKIMKLARGRIDLYSRRGEGDLAALAGLAGPHGASDMSQARIAAAKTVAEAFACADLSLGDVAARNAWQVATQVLRPAPIELEIKLFDRGGVLIGCAGMARVGEDHRAPRDRKRR